MNKEKIMSAPTSDGSAGKVTQSNAPVANKSESPKSNTMSSTGHKDIVSGSMVSGGMK